MAILGHHTQCKRMSEARFKIELRSQAMIKTAKNTYFAFLSFCQHGLFLGDVSAAPRGKIKGERGYFLQGTAIMM